MGDRLGTPGVVGFLHTVIVAICSILDILAAQKILVIEKVKQRLAWQKVPSAYRINFKLCTAVPNGAPSTTIILDNPIDLPKCQYKNQVHRHALRYLNQRIKFR